MESSDPPDVLPVFPEIAPEAEQKGLLRDLLQLQFKDLDIPDQVLESVKIDGKLLVLPYAAYPQGVYFDKRAFDEVQIPYPQGDWTWEQFRDISRALKQTGAAMPYNISTLSLLMQSIGVDVISPQGDTSIGYLDSPETVRTLHWLNALQTSPADLMGVLGSFDGRQTAMFVGGWVIVSVLTKEKTKTS